MNEVRVHIDQHSFNSPNPTTGAALYALGHVLRDLALFKEVRGDEEDRPVPNDGTQLTLLEDEHFHSGKLTITIKVNGTPTEVHKVALTYTEVVQLAYPSPPDGNNPDFAVTFKHAASVPHHGKLSAGGRVEVKDGTILDVTPTNCS
jgi:Multiubiquitin